MIMMIVKREINIEVIVGEIPRTINGTLIISVKRTNIIFPKVVPILTIVNRTIEPKPSFGVSVLNKPYLLELVVSRSAMVLFKFR